MSTDKEIRGAVIDELLDAENWFTIVTTKEGVKVFSNMSYQDIMRGVCTLMMNNTYFANAVVGAVDMYVKRQQREAISKSISKN